MNWVAFICGAFMCFLAGWVAVEYYKTRRLSWLLLLIWCIFWAIWDFAGVLGGV